MKTPNSKREQMARESWINNVMKVMGWSREDAEKVHDRIHTLANSQQDIPPDIKRIVDDHFMELL